MNAAERIDAFSNLGTFLNHLSHEEFQSIAESARNENPWFTKENVRMAVSGISARLNNDTLTSWLAQYPQLSNLNSKKVALVMAGNIPLVGFHDLLCVLISGHEAQIKLSSKDSFLTKYIINRIIDIEPRFENAIAVVERLKDFDAVIATGSDNSSRYFEFYFDKYPHIIRKNRTSIAILTGEESDDDLQNLGTDIFSYFGLGCRNVSKLFVPKNYAFDRMFQQIEYRKEIINHHKYCNNYDYQKSILLVNSVPFLDNLFLILEENTKIVSPISVLYYERYADQEDLNAKVSAVADKIQCMVGSIPPATIPFGEAQFPSLLDYADQVDTLQFLSTLR